MRIIAADLQCSKRQRDSCFWHISRAITQHLNNRSCLWSFSIDLYQRGKRLKTKTLLAASYAFNGIFLIGFSQSLHTGTPRCSLKYKKFRCQWLEVWKEQHWILFIYKALLGKQPAFFRVLFKYRSNSCCTRSRAYLNITMRNSFLLSAIVEYFTKTASEGWPLLRNLGPFW